MDNLQIHYVRQVQGEVTRAQFACVTAPLPSAAEGQLLVRNIYLSLDPYQRRQMMPDVNYGQPLRVGEVMTGRDIARVVSSCDSRFAPGDWVRGAFGWQVYAAVDALKAERIELDGFSPTAFLGVLGNPGLTAWVGLRAIARAQRGETVVISAATGAVGSVVAALAAASGCRVVGIAGGQDKCAHAVKALNFEACVDHRSPDFAAQLEASTPAGVDINFENVGGMVFDAVLRRLNDFSRVVLCGLVSQYNLLDPYGMRHIAELLNKSVMLQGFRVSSYMQHRESAYAEIKVLLRQGLLTQHETVIDGLEKAPDAFIGLLRGHNLGKQLIRIGPDQQ